MSSQASKSTEGNIGCYFCGKDIRFASVLYLVRKATKPPYSPYRMMTIGSACETCGETNKTTFDKWKD